MIINNPVADPHLVDEYDLTFSNGLFMSVTVDKVTGDTVDFDTSPLTVIFHLSPKVSPTDHVTIIPAEIITIFVDKLLSIQHRSRIITPPTLEQQEALRNTILAVTAPTDRSIVH